MNYFFTALRALPDSAKPGGEVIIDNEPVDILQFDSVDLAKGLGVSFDEAIQNLSALDRMFIELDGSFVWVSENRTPLPENRPDWQIDGNLYERGDLLNYIEIKGTIPEQEFNTFLNALNWPKYEVMFEMPKLGCYLAEKEFREIVFLTE